MHLLGLKAPGDMEIVLDCQKKGRFIIFSWLDGLNWLVMYEGIKDDFGDSNGWKNFLERDYVAKAVKGYRLIGNEQWDATHSLVLDRKTRKLWICDIHPDVVQKTIVLLQTMHGEKVHTPEPLDASPLPGDTIKHTCTQLNANQDKRNAASSTEDRPFLRLIKNSLERK